MSLIFCFHLGAFTTLTIELQSLAICRWIFFLRNLATRNYFNLVKICLYCKFTILQSGFKTAFLKVSTSVRKTQPLDLALMVTGISQPANLPWCFSLSQKLRDSARRNQSSHIVRVPSSPAANAASLALVLP
jgi:hypothetical protein